METIFYLIKGILIGIILMIIKHECYKNQQKLLSVRDSVIFLLRSLSMIPQAIFSTESRLQMKQYGESHPKEKETVGKWMDLYFWQFQRRVMIYFLPPALMYLVWAEPRLQGINIPSTYIILCMMGLVIGLLFDLVRSDFEKSVE